MSKFDRMVATAFVLLVFVLGGWLSITLDRVVYGVQVLRKELEAQKALLPIGAPQRVQENAEPEDTPVSSLYVPPVFVEKSSVGTYRVVWYCRVEGAETDDMDSIRWRLKLVMQEKNKEAHNIGATWSISETHTPGVAQ